MPCQPLSLDYLEHADSASYSGSSSSSSGDEAGDTHSGTESSSDSASDVDSTHAHHTEGTGVRQPAHATFQAQQARLQRLRKDLEACRFMPPMELGCAYNSRASMATLDEAVEGFEVGSSSSSSSAVPGLPSHLQEAEDKMTVLLPPPSEFQAHTVRPPPPTQHRSPDPEPSSSVDNSCSSGSSMDDGISGRGPTIPKCEAKSSTEPPESDQQHEHTHFSEDRIKMLINAATALQRLEFRRHGSLHRAAPDSCAVLLHCDELDADVVACVAGWLHWYGKLPLREAIQAAEEKLFWRVEQGLLEAATKYLTDGALDRMNKVVITWTQGGLSAHVAGDIVGSWSTRVSMVRCRRADGCHGFTSPGHFFLVICGLPAGTYYYKYIVDGSWTIDSESDKLTTSSAAPSGGGISRVVLQ
ncbi:MAG: hypothetical protein WDW36_010281 [Sanguina aurantia]